MSKISVGLMPAEEIDDLKPYARSIWSVAYRDLISSAQMDYMLDRLYSPDRLKQEVAAGNPLFSATIGDETVGFAHLFIEGHQARLDKLYVSPLFQRMGVGRQLVKHVFRHAITSDCSLITLRVNRNNAPAIAAYESMGFGIIATNKKDIGGGYVMDDYLMLADLILPD
jgi:ribosomal protein S18 acetylase RimI-like enzyme